MGLAVGIRAACYKTCDSKTHEICYVFLLQPLYANSCTYADIYSKKLLMFY